jgi:pilus assembly protein Flp/PilA
MHMTNPIRDFWNDEDGVTAIEYGLLAALIAVAIIAGAGLLGTNLNTMFNNIAARLVAPAPN